jgi:AraC-like DNA-binding protein
MSNLYLPFQPTLTQSGLRKFGLTIRSAPPCDALKDIVNFYLQIKAERPTPYPVVPDGTQAVYISSQGSIVGGAQVKTCDIQILQPGEYFGIWFSPGSLRHLFNLNLEEVSGQFVDDRFFDCRIFSQLHENIYRYKNFLERVNICEKWLLNRHQQKPATKFDQALFLIYSSRGGERVSQIANNVGWTSRHLNRQFLQHTGLNTKTFSQIIRIQHVCRQLYLNPNESLIAALDTGYFDQAHLIKDFKKRLASTPDTFFDRFLSDFYNS